jgi:hypothetical protein
LTGPPSLSPASSRAFEGTLIRVRRLRKEIDELERDHREREDLPGTRVLLSALRSIVYEFERYAIDRARHLYKERGTEAANQSFRKRVGGLLTALELLLPEPLDVARQPFGREIEALISPFSDLARLISPGRELIFLPSDEYEFDDTLRSSLVDYARNFRLSLARSLEDLPDLTVISYPRFLNGDVLLHTVLAHEIAHLAYERKHPDQIDAPLGRTVIGANIDERYEALEEELLERIGPEAGPQELAEAERSARDRIFGWFEELTCDRLATLMVGPAYLFALFDLEMPGNRWAQRRGMPGFITHPGLGWRIRELLPLAREFFPATENSPAFEAGCAALDEVEAIIPAEKDEIGQVEREIIEGALREISQSKYISAALPSNADYLRKEILEEELNLVWSKLANRIPPAERIRPRSTDTESPAPWVEDAPWSQPMDWRSILNGAYLFWLAGKPRTDEEGRMRTMPLSSLTVSDWHEFNAHVRGTVELAVIQKQAIDVRDRLKRANLPGGP